MFNFLSQLSSELTKPHTIRPATLKDSERIADLQLRLFGHCWGPIDFIHAKMHPKLSLHVVEGRLLKRIVAFAACYIGRDAVDLMWLGVASSHQRRSIGRELVQTLQNLHGWPRHLRAYVRETDLGAQLFFRAVGFRMTGTLKGHDCEDSYCFTWRPKDEGARVIEAVLAGER